MSPDYLDHSAETSRSLDSVQLQSHLSAASSQSSYPTVSSSHAHAKSLRRRQKSGVRTIPIPPEVKLKLYGVWGTTVTISSHVAPRKRVSDRELLSIRPSGPAVSSAAYMDLVRLEGRGSFYRQDGRGRLRRSHRIASQLDRAPEIVVSREMVGAEDFQRGQRKRKRRRR